MIDIHVHLHPPRLSAAIRRWFAENSDWALYHPTEPGEVCRTLRQHGVERFAFCSYAHKPAMAAELNDWLIRTSKDIGGFGLPLATVHLDDSDVVEYLKDAFERGCIGLKIHEDVQRFGINDPRLAPIYEVIAEHRGFVLAHVGPVPWDSTPRQAPERVATVLREHPKVNFVIAHMGVPDTRRYLQLTVELSNLYLDTTMSLTEQLKAFERPAKEIFTAHSQRIIFGTDYPNVPHPYDLEAKLLEGFGLPELDLRRLFHDNAAGLMHVD